MPAVTRVYEDRWGAIIDHADAGYLEIRRYDTIGAMSVDEFQRWLTKLRPLGRTVPPVRRQ